MHMNYLTLKDRAQTVTKGYSAGMSSLDKPQLASLVALGDNAEEIVALIAAYSEAIDDIAFWAHYASEYYQLKHDLVGKLRKHQQRLAGHTAHHSLLQSG